VRFLHDESRSLAVEIGYSGQEGVEVVSPYWTRSFVEFMLSLPAHQVYRPGTTKLVGRQAMRGSIPEAIRGRQNPTLLTPLFDRGMFYRERAQVARLLDRQHAQWQWFVDPEVIHSVRPTSPSAHKVLLWRCVSFELWRKKHGWCLA